MKVRFGRRDGGPCGVLRVGGSPAAVKVGAPGAVQGDGGGGEVPEDGEGEAHLEQPQRVGGGALGLGGPRQRGGDGDAGEEGQGGEGAVLARGAVAEVRDAAAADLEVEVVGGEGGGLQEELGAGVQVDGAVGGAALGGPAGRWEGGGSGPRRRRSGGRRR